MLISSSRATSQSKSFKTPSTRTSAMQLPQMFENTGHQQLIEQLQRSNNARNRASLKLQSLPQENQEYFFMRNTQHLRTDDSIRNQYKTSNLLNKNFHLMKPSNKTFKSFSQRRQDNSSDRGSKSPESSSHLIHLKKPDVAQVTHNCTLFGRSSHPERKYKALSQQKLK